MKCFFPVSYLIPVSENKAAPALLLFFIFIFQSEILILGRYF